MRFAEVGNLVAPFELRYTQSGKAVASTNLAINHSHKQDNEWVDDGASFFRLTVWDKLAEAVTNSGMGKGSRVIVVGEWRQRPWEDKQGNKRSSDEVTVKQIGLAIRPETGTQQPQTSAPVSSPSGWEEEPQQGAWGNTDAPF